MLPKPTSITSIQRLAATWRAAGLLCFAGSPQPQAPPLGMQNIRRRLSSPSPTSTALGGLTLIKNAVAFTAPVFDTTTSSQRVGIGHVDHFATVNSTTSQDATHESYYAAAGIHQKPGGTSHEFWEISDSLAAQIRQGEQEHLDDALLAYELTYKCVENAINALVGQRFGPASTPAAATQMALDALGRRLPTQLGIDPRTWFAALDRLLLLTNSRDTNLMHALEGGNIRHDRGRSIQQVVPSTFFRVGQVPSSQIVRL